VIKLPTIIKYPQLRASTVSVQSVFIPLVVALIGAGATVAAPIVGSPASPSGSTTPSGASVIISPAGGLTISGIDSDSRMVECAIYEEGFLVPLARINYKLAAPLLNSHSSINYMCGLLPSPSPSPSPSSSSPSPSLSPSPSSPSPSPSTVTLSPTGAP
jgi:hypothetical protein